MRIKDSGPVLEVDNYYQDKFAYWNSVRNGDLQLASFNLTVNALSGIVLVCITIYLSYIYIFID